MAHKDEVKCSARQVLADNVRRYRSAAGRSQEDLAELAGFHRTYISQVERLKANVTIDNVERIAAVLNVSVADLLTERVPSGIEGGNQALSEANDGQ